MPTTLPTFSSGEKLDAAKLQALVEAIKELRESVAGPTQLATPEEPVVDCDPAPFIAQIDAIGATTSKHKATEQVTVSGTLGDFADSPRNCTDDTDSSAYEDIQGWKNVPVNRFVLALEMQEQDSRRMRFVYTIPPPATQDGSVAYAIAYDPNTKTMKHYAVPDLTKKYAFIWNVTDWGFEEIAPCA